MRLGTSVIIPTSDGSSLVWITSALTLNLIPVAFSLHIAFTPSVSHGPPQLHTHTHEGMFIFVTLYLQQLHLELFFIIIHKRARMYAEWDDYGTDVVHAFRFLTGPGVPF